MTQHPALLLKTRERYPRAVDLPDWSQARLLRLCAWRPDDAYGIALKRWRDSFHADGSAVFEIEVSGSLSTGAGECGVDDFGIALHHTYGVPVVPGSTLKGVTRAHARAVGVGDHLQSLIFGAADDKSHAGAGCVVFHDAWWCGQGQPLRRDVLTPHHKDYGTDGAKPPADWDSPVPVGFLTATGRFLVALECADPELLAFVRRLVVQVGEERGIGAKTAAGYGRYGAVGDRG